MKNKSDNYFVKFSLVIFTITSLTFPSISMETWALPGSGTLFGTDAFDGELITIDTSTGVKTTVGFGALGPSLAIDPATGTMYASSVGGAGLLYSVNPDTGATTEIGPLVNANAAPGLDFRSDGTLFATAKTANQAGGGGTSLATINTATGLLTLIGPLGVDSMGAIAFASDGTLYGATENKGKSPFGALYTINTTTGEATLVVEIRDNLDDPHPGGFSSIQFACDGTLFYGGGNFEGDFGTININTGVYTQINSATVTGSLGGLAYEFDCDQDNDGSELPTDCDDADDTVYPGAPELDDGKDNDCDTLVDEGLDGDGDGFTPVFGADCDDADATVYPGAPEIIDGKDNDCDTLVDEGLDGDGDGVETPTDCDDNDNTVYPGAPELDDGKDNDCDTEVDEGLDGDGDGFTPVNGADCDDADATVFPGAPELDDGKDNDCDTMIDEGLDGDGDGFTPVFGSDCDDGNSAINPDATETPANDIDENCDNTVVCYLDEDNDDFGVGAGVESTYSATNGIADVASACSSSNLDGWDDTNDDCNDSDQTIFPGAPELNDGKDNDCDGSIDEGLNGGGGDSDNDGISNGVDNCPTISNPLQEDIDGDGTGDVCDNSTDISTNTVLTENFASLGDLVISNNALLTINSGVTVTIQSGHNLSIQSGSGVLIKSGGTLQINS